MPDRMLVPCRPSRLRVLLLALGALTLAGCYSFAQPSFDPGDARDVLLALGLRGVEARSSVTGGSACDDPGLAGNALHLVVRMPPEQETRDVYVYTFRPRNWEGSSEAVDACQAEYAAAHPGSDITRFDVPTYRAFGADWPDELADAVLGALEEASDKGG